MRTSTIFAVLLAIAVDSASSAKAASTILVPKYTPEATKGLFSGLFSESLIQESHLPVALFQETNTSFDLKLYESVRSTLKPPMTVSFLLVTFIFSSPNTNDPVYSFCEMGRPHDLMCTDRSISRISRGRNSTNEIPLIRVSTVDRHRKDLLADLDLLIGVAPADHPGDVRYLRRSFRFVYRDGWKED